MRRLFVLLFLLPTAGLRAQVPFPGEVRQIVTFRILPGQTAEVLRRYREAVRPLYVADTAMRSFRAFREVESAVPLDLVVVSGFAGMAGMDASNAALGPLAAAAGTSIGALYGGLAALTSGHTDEFVALRPVLGRGDPTARRLTAFFRYRVVPGQEAAFERVLAGAVVPAEAASGLPTATGRFLLTDGWDYLRLVGFDDLAAYQAYVQGGTAAPLDHLTVARRDVLLAALSDLSVR